MSLALIHRFLGFIHGTFKNGFLSVHVANPKMEFQDCLQSFIDKYRHSLEQDRINSKELVKREWNPIDGFEVLVTQMMEGITYAQYANSPISDTDIVDITIGVVMKCGLLAKAYLKWHERADTARTWIDFQPFWSSQLKLGRITMMTAGQMGFVMNATKTHQQEELNKQMDSF